MSVKSLLHKVIWKYRNATGYLKLFPSVKDVQAYRRSASGGGEQAGQGIKLALRALGGHQVICRPGTTDPAVLWDAFYWQYHVPPPHRNGIKTIVDLGANVGYTVAHYAALFPEAKVIGVEMDAVNARQARLNTAACNRCSIVEAAIWTEPGEIAYGGDESWGFAISDQGASHARAITMEQLFAEAAIETVDLLKMDIEGAEHELFKADATWLNQVRNAIIEFHPPVEEVWLVSRLETYGFQCRRLKRTNSIWAEKVDAQSHLDTRGATSEAEA